MLEIDGKLVSYAQNREDVILFGYLHGLSKPGFYVDIGANHPVEDSVTKFFALRGWRGINVEPLPSLHALLKADRPRDKNIQAGISNRRGQAVIREYDKHGLSTFSSYHQTGYAQAVDASLHPFVEHRVPLLTLKAIFQKYAANRPIHFLKVDVEGFETKVLSGNNWQRYRPWVICIEATGHDKGWQTILETAGYQPHIHDGLNSYYVASEHSQLIDNYRVVVASEVVRFDVARQLDRARRRAVLRRLWKQSFDKLVESLK